MSELDIFDFGDLPGSIPGEVRIENHSDHMTWRLRFLFDNGGSAQSRRQDRSHPLRRGEDPRR